MANTKKDVKTVPYIGTERLVIYRVKTDSTTAYEPETDAMLEITDGSVSVSYSVSATETSFYSSNKKTVTDFSYSPTATLAYAGDSAEIDKLLFGKKNDGGAMLENMGAAPTFGCFYVLNMAENEWVVRQILKAQASKDDVTVSTKAESTTFTNPSATLSPLASVFFNSYSRDFYSTDPLLVGKTASDVIDALITDPSHKFSEVAV